MNIKALINCYPSFIKYEFKFVLHMEAGGTVHPDLTRLKGKKEEEIGKLGKVYQKVGLKRK